MPDKFEVKVSCRCQSSAQQVYDAWLDPNKVRSWLTVALQEMGLAGDVGSVEIDPTIGDIVAAGPTCSLISSIRLTGSGILTAWSSKRCPLL